MKILLVHNYLRPPSGENVVFENERKLLEDHGNDVVTYVRHNDEIAAFGPKDMAALLWQTIWSNRTYTEIQRLIDVYSPDVAHFHNTFPLVSLSAYRACFDKKLPVIQTLHHYRMICPGALLFRDGRICDDCVKGSLWNGAFHGCYNKSRFKTALVALQIYLHRKIGSFRRVTYFLALNQFCKDLFVRAGIPAEQIHIKPNFLFDSVTPSYSQKGFALYLGRVSAEKDVSTLIQAWSRLSRREHLKIVGAGDQLEELKALAVKLNLNEIEFLGYQPKSVCDKLVQDSRFLIVTSSFYETFSLVVREGFAAGKPVIASRLGVLAEAVTHGKTGLTFTPGDPADLAEKVEWLLSHKEESSAMGKNARREYEEKYTPEVNYRMLISIYEAAISAPRSK
jgi:glycosyltransferase involved in cell wall biosynthesis